MCGFPARTLWRSRPSPRRCPQFTVMADDDPETKPRGRSLSFIERAAVEAAAALKSEFTSRGAFARLT